MSYRIRSWMVAALAVAALQPAAAADVVSAPVPSAVADAQITIAGRTLSLPGGSWTLVARTEGSIRIKSQRSTTYFTAYAMQVEGKDMRAGVVLRLPVNSTPMDSWREESCRMADAIYRDDFGEIARTAQCLALMKRRSHLSVPTTNEFYTQAQQWTVSEGVKPGGPFYEILYSRFGTNEFGLVRVFVPAAAFANDEQAIAWAQQLPPALRPFFEGRQRQAALPALPARNP